MKHLMNHFFMTLLAFFLAVSTLPLHVSAETALKAPESITGYVDYRVWIYPELPEGQTDFTADIISGGDIIRFKDSQTSYRYGVCFDCLKTGTAEVMITSSDGTQKTNTIITVTDGDPSFEESFFEIGKASGDKPADEQYGNKEKNPEIYYLIQGQEYYIYTSHYGIEENYALTSDDNGLTDRLNTAGYFTDVRAAWDETGAFGQGIGVVFTPVHTGAVTIKACAGHTVKLVIAEMVDMHRLYNPNSGEHFYTGKGAEKDALVKLGWQYEGTGWTAPSVSSSPVYRMYNKTAGDHHYTMNSAERDALIRIGWTYEGIGWYSDDSETIPLYRQYNPHAYSCNHNYTTNKKENDVLVNMGWIAEGIGWYGITEGKPAPKPAPTVIPAPAPSAEPAPDRGHAAVEYYVLNINSKVFHRPDCVSVHKMKEHNKKYFHDTTRDEMIAKGYKPCSNCNP